MMCFKKSLLLGLSFCLPGSANPDTDFVAALQQDDECESPDCSLELAQLRASKLAQPPPGVSLAADQTGQSTWHPHWVSDGGLGYKHPGWLASCKHIFLDVGSNTGVNVRKLFEPEKYPGAKLLPAFDESFGKADARKAPATESGLCALGLEPNAKHHERLSALEKAYHKKGWHVHFYPLAAWFQDGYMPFNVTGQRAGNAEKEESTNAGAHLAMKSTRWPGERGMMVQTIDLSRFVKTLPAQSDTVMVMDIEGSEYETLGKMIETNVLCKNSIKTALVEAHEWGELINWGKDHEYKGRSVHPRSFQAIAGEVEKMNCDGEVTSVVELDDETYSDDVDDKFGESA